MAVLAAVLVVVVLAFATAGVDFTDEGYYLNRLKYAGDFPSTTQFDLVYRPLYLVVGGNIVWLRWANVLLTVGLAWGLVRLMASRLGLAHESATTGGLSMVAFAVPALLVFGDGLITPNYNTLTLQGMMVAMAGMVGLTLREREDPYAKWALTLGIGGALTFLGKPTSAAALAVVVAVGLALVRRLRLRSVTLAVLAALAVLVGVSALGHGGPLALVEQLRVGADVAATLEARHTLLEVVRMDRLSGTPTQLAVLVGLVLLVVVGTRRRVSGPGESSLSRTPLAWVLLIVVVAAMVVDLRFVVRIAPGHALWLLALPLAMGLMLVGAPRARLNRRALVLAGSLLVLPLAGAFGTNFNYWRAGVLYGEFWVLAALALGGAWPSTEAEARRRRLAVASAALAIVGIVIAAILVYPYRQPPHAWSWDSSATVGVEGSRLRLNEPMAQLLGDLQSQAQQAGLHPDTRLLDLTGGFPGLSNLMGARPVGQAWTLGYYPGSDEFVVVGLGNESCDEVAAAWLLYENDGPRTISASVLDAVGADFETDYEVVETWSIPERTGVAAGPRIVELLRPTRDEAVAREVCLQARNDGSG